MIGSAAEKRRDTNPFHTPTGRSTDAKVSLGKGLPKAILRRQAIDHANTMAAKAMVTSGVVSMVLMAGTPADRFGLATGCPVTPRAVTDACHNRLEA
jgi:hypothetical protein